MVNCVLVVRRFNGGYSAFKIAPSAVVAMPAVEALGYHDTGLDHCKFKVKLIKELQDIVVYIANEFSESVEA